MPLDKYEYTPEICILCRCKSMTLCGWDLGSLGKFAYTTKFAWHTPPRLYDIHSHSHGIHLSMYQGQVSLQHTQLSSSVQACLPLWPADVPSLHFASFVGSFSCNGAWQQLSKTASLLLVLRKKGHHGRACFSLVPWSNKSPDPPNHGY